ncbi:unnamed protein product [Somion occarium]|uniref:Uncharacterized protein n=1 Tax=Somion occarium TaxID=3059160 RepID=A0ABP1CPE9_9APHY
MSKETVAKNKSQASASTLPSKLPKCEVKFDMTETSDNKVDKKPSISKGKGRAREVSPKPIRTEAIYAPADTIVDAVMSSVSNVKQKTAVEATTKKGKECERPSADPRDPAVSAGQIALHSYLGLAISNAVGSQSRRNSLSSMSSASVQSPSVTDGSDSGNSSPSDPSDSSFSDSDSSSSSSSSSSGAHHHRKHCQWHHKAHHRHKSKKDKRPLWKPVSPQPYDGRADAEVFHCFVRQATEMINGYNIPRHMIPSTIANYLTGRAYDFYANTIAEDPRRWMRLRDIFIGLFNYCFPMDF